MEINMHRLHPMLLSTGGIYLLMDIVSSLLIGVTLWLWGRCLQQRHNLFPNVISIFSIKLLLELSQRESDKSRSIRAHYLNLYSLLRKAMAFVAIEILLCIITIYSLLNWQWEWSSANERHIIWMIILVGWLVGLFVFLAIWLKRLRRMEKTVITLYKRLKT